MTLDILDNTLFLDIETTGLDPKTSNILVLGIYNPQTKEYKTYLEHEIPAILPQLETHNLIGWNISFDLNC